MANKLTIAERVQIVKWSYAGHSQREVVEIFGQHFPVRPQPTQSFISKLLARFETTGSVCEKKHTGRRKSATAAANTDALCAAVEVNPKLSIRSIAMDSGISKTSIQRVLKREHYHPYKLQCHQKLNEDDPDRRSQYCEWAMEKCNREEDFLQRVCFSDEATFYLNGEVNRHNCRYWSKENPHWMEEGHAQELQKVNVWAGIFGDNIIGPFFWKGTSTVTSTCICC